MIIEVDLDKVLDYDISVNQYIFIKSLSSNQLDRIKSFVSNRISDDDIVDLINKCVITDDSTKVKASLTEEFIDSISGTFQKDLFQIFYEIYPTSVVRPDGIKDYLRTDLNRCKKLYKQIVGNNHVKHDNLIKCLNYEIENKRKTNKMGYFKKMRTWLVSEQWIEAEEALKDFKPLITMAYGTDIQ